MSSVPPEVAEMHTRLFNVIADPKFASMDMGLAIVTVTSLLEHLIRSCSNPEGAAMCAERIMAGLRSKWPIQPSTGVPLS